MLFSLALIFLLGIFLGDVFEKIRLPSLLGMLLTGMVLGPYMLNILDKSILNISTELRQIALIIILTRAGLNLDIQSLRKSGRPALLLCFLPASIEIAGMILIAPLLFKISLLDAAIMGTVVAAVSPAVVVPRMLNLIEEGYGTGKSIPQMIMAGSSVDDVFVIVLFTAFTSVAAGKSAGALQFLQIPSSIVLGVVIGSVVGMILTHIFTRFHIRDSGKVVIVLSFSFLLVTLEKNFTGNIGFSGLLAVMSLAAAIQQKKKELGERLSLKFSKLWVAAEPLLFVLVGATVNIHYGLKAGIPAVLLIFSVMLFRIAGVFLCLVKTKLNKKERLFIVFSYMPKATVQAAIGGLPLAMGLSVGDLSLTVAVLSIVLTAPIGAVLIDRSYKKCLTKEKY